MLLIAEPTSEITLPGIFGIVSKNENGVTPGKLIVGSGMLMLPKLRVPRTGPKSIEPKLMLMSGISSLKLVLKPFSALITLLTSPMKSVLIPVSKDTVVVSTNPIPSLKKGTLLHNAS